jgi:hypothetical protein
MTTTERFHRSQYSWGYAKVTTPGRDYHKFNRGDSTIELHRSTYMMKDSAHG